MLGKTGFKVVLALCLVAIASGVAFALHSPADAPIREGLTADLDQAFEWFDDAQEIIDEHGRNSGTVIDAFTRDGIEYALDGDNEQALSINKELLPHAFRDADYHIGGIDIDGDTAVAHVAFTHLDIDDLIERTSKQVLDNEELLLQCVRDDLEMNETETPTFFKAIIEQLDRSSSATSDVDIPLHKEDGVWAIDEDFDLDQTLVELYYYTEYGIESFLKYTIALTLASLANPPEAIAEEMKQRLLIGVDTSTTDGTAADVVLTYAMRNFDYTIDDVDVAADGVTGTASVSITCLDYATYEKTLGSLNEAGGAFAEGGSRHDELLAAVDANDEAAVAKLLREELEKALEADKPLVQKQVALDLAYGQEGWELQEGELNSVEDFLINW